MDSRSENPRESQWTPGSAKCYVQWDQGFLTPLMHRSCIECRKGHMIRLPEQLLGLSSALAVIYEKANSSKMCENHVCTVSMYPAKLHLHISILPFHLQALTTDLQHVNIGRSKYRSMNNDYTSAFLPFLTKYLSTY